MTNREFRLQVKLMLKLMELKQYDELEALLREVIKDEKE